MNDRELPSPTVLVVENDPLLKLLTADIVEEAGFAALQAKDAGKALSILAAHPDIVTLITDVRISDGMDGIKLAHVARERWPLMQIIGVSADGRVSEADFPAGSRFFRKPYPPHILVSAIQTMSRVANDPLHRPRRFYLNV
jgi:CheY-like chemotaxis protein